MNGIGDVVVGRGVVQRRGAEDVHDAVISLKRAGLETDPLRIDVGADGGVDLGEDVKFAARRIELCSAVP